MRLEAEPDRPFLEALFREAREAEFAPLGWSNADVTALLANQFDIQQRSYAAAFPTAERLIVQQRGHPIGRLYVERRDRDLHLVDIAIAASKRGLGIGSLLINALQSEVLAGEADRLTLSVDHDNVGARRLYARLGFTERPPRSRYAEISIEMSWRP